MSEGGSRNAEGGNMENDQVNPVDPVNKGPNHNDYDAIAQN
jgi:hypothetical protein